MSATSYLLNRKGSYYFRIAIPTHLRPTFGALELNRSLQTKYLPEAKERSTILLTSVRELFKVVTAMPRLTPDEIKQLSRTYFHEVVFPRFNTWWDAAQTQNRFKVLPSVEFEQRKGPSIEELVGNLIHPNGYKQGEFLQAMAKELIKQQKVKIERFSINYKELLRQGLQPVKEEVESLVKLAAHSQPPEIQTDWLKPIAPALLTANSLTISQLFAKYDEYEDNAGSDMHQQHQTALIFWLDVFGDTPISKIDVALAAKCELYLKKIPKGWKRAVAYRDKPLADILTMTIPEKDRAKPKTINDRLSLYSKVFEWAKTRSHYASENPFKGLRVKQNVRAQDQRTPYSLPQLKAIFTSPLYAGCKSESRRVEQGDKVIWDGLYWAPLIALHSGARMNEICQLHLSDIRQEQDIWVFDFNDDGAGKHIKTEAGCRLVPIHSKLIELGLLEYKDQISKREELRLFPDIHLRGKSKRYSDDLTRKYAYYIEQIKLDRKNGAVFHSYRHNMTSELRAKEVREDISHSIIGHEDKTTHSRYGDTTVQVTKVAVEKVSYNIDWALLMAGKERATLKDKF